MPAKKITTQAGDKTKAVELVIDLRAARADLRTGIKALPAPAARTAAQRRDVLVMRTCALLVQAVLVILGSATTADRDATEA